jgi:hypothetical protein
MADPLLAIAASHLIVITIWTFHNHLLDSAILSSMKTPQPSGNDIGSTWLIPGEGSHAGLLDGGSAQRVSNQKENYSGLSSGVESGSCKQL